MLGMSLLRHLEKKFGRWAVPNLTTLLIAGQVLLYFVQTMSGAQGGGDPLASVQLWPSAVMQGEVWRLVTFLFVPPNQSMLFILFYWMLLFRYGTALEQRWGTFRFNLFLLIGYLANVAAAFVAWGVGSEVVANSGYFLFLAFARFYPNFVLQLFFILPIQIKWLALLAWIGYGYQLLTGDWMTRFLVVASVLNYLLFFGREHFQDVKQGQRRRSFQAQDQKASKSLVHRCLVCELDSEASPKTLFRYCSKCVGQCCYCPEHIRDHEHVAANQHELNAE